MKKFQALPTYFIQMPAVLFFLLAPAAALAVMPPDFIFNIGAQLVQVFSVVFLMLSTLFAATAQFLKMRLASFRLRPLYIIPLLVIIAAISYGITYAYKDYRQKKEYAIWLKESQEQKDSNGGELFRENDTPPEGALDEEAGSGGRVIDDKANGDLDKLKFGQIELPKNENKNLRFTANLPGLENDSSVNFIKDYYGSIANGDLDRAYLLSKKTVSTATFKGWYEKTTRITLDKAVRIDAERSSLELTLYEGDDYTRYGVLMTLAFSGGRPKNVEKSEVRVLGQGSLAPQGGQAEDNPADDFYDLNKGKPLAITNEEFKRITDSGDNNYIVLDAREDVEYENGNFPGSTHIRFPDIKAGRWIEIPADKFVYVICWSGIRGKEVAEFLRDKRLAAFYPEGGANGWYKFGGQWEGGITLPQKYAKESYRRIYKKDEVVRKMAEGVMIVDSREPYKFKNWHIPGSVNIPMMYTPTVKLIEAFSQVPKNSQVIAVCDDYVNCFDAKITGIELDSRGHVFLGSYNKPWELRK